MNEVQALEALQDLGFRHNQIITTMENLHRTGWDKVDEILIERTGADYTITNQSLIPQIECGECAGTTKCAECDEDGEIFILGSDGELRAETCSVCQGTTVCQNCGGTGEISMVPAGDAGWMSGTCSTPLAESGYTPGWQGSEITPLGRIDHMNAVSRYPDAR
jgi:hypothetical protein